LGAAVSVVFLGAFFFFAFLVILVSSDLVSFANEIATDPRAKDKPNIRVISFFIVVISL
jgi:hypothetical protein